MTAALAALALAASALDAVDLHADAAWHLRFTDRVATPSPALLFDRAARTFDTASYLAPRGEDAYASTLLAAGIEARAGRFRLRLAVDSGELREQRFPRLSAVCATSRSARDLPFTGLDVRASSRCDLDFAGRPSLAPPSVQLEDTRRGATEVTSNGRALSGEARRTLLVREAWVSAVLGANDALLVKVGRRRFTVADGFVYDDWGTGVEASLDLGALGPPFDVALAVFYPTRDLPRAAGVTTPMVALRADWLPSLFDHAGVFAAFYRDRTDELAELFRGSLAEPEAIRLAGTAIGTAEYAAEARTLAVVLGRPLRSDGRLAWVGTSGSLSLRPVGRLEWTGAILAGRLTLGTGARDVESRLSGRMAWVRLRRDVARRLELSASFLYLSGDLPPTERARLGLSERYGGFLGVVPWITATNLFFQGGVSETFAARQATAPGVNGRGVVAPGLGARLDLGHDVTIATRAAWLLADERGPFGGRTYGPEADLEASWSPAPHVALVAEGDALWPGDFFPSRRTITKVVLGMDLSWP